MFLYNWWCSIGYSVSEQVVWLPGKEIEEANTCLTSRGNEEKILQRDTWLDYFFSGKVNDYKIFFLTLKCLLNLE